MTKNSCCCENTDYNKKKHLIEEFTALVKEKRQELCNVSQRQLEIYDNYIKDLELSPRTITMRDVRNRHIMAEDYMECECKEEDCNKDYTLVFDELWLELRRYIREEIKQLNKTPKWHPFIQMPLQPKACWIENVHFCDECKNIYERTVQYGLMNPDYSWKKDTSKIVISEWIDMFASRFKISKKWVWAKDVWNINNLRQRKYDRLNEEDMSKFLIIDKIFNS